jgi:hypothetical protein
MPNRPSARLTEALSALEVARATSDPAPKLDLFGPPADLEPVMGAIESVAEHAGEEWKAQALAVVERVARALPELTVEDVAPLVEATVDMRALGAIMLTAKRRGWIVAAGYVAAGAERHAKPIRLWRSRLYRSEVAS